MKYKFEQLDTEIASHDAALEQVSEWSGHSDTMKFYTKDELEEHPLGILAFTEESDELAGYVAVTEINEIDDKKYGKVGAFAVGKAFQGNGVGQELIAHIMPLAAENLPEVEKYYAYVHEGSLKPFLENEAEIIGPRTPSSSTGCNIIVNLNPQGVVN